MRRLPDVETIDRARKGDVGAVDVVLAGIRPVLVSFFSGRIGPGPDAQDLTQNTLLRLNRGLAELNDPNGFKSFAMRAAVFELQDFYRGRNRTKERLFDPHDAPDVPHTDPPAGQEFDLERVLAAITPHARRILELRAYGYQYAEIADMVGSTNAAVKMQVKRALDKLRDLSTLALVCLPWLPLLLRNS